MDFIASELIDKVVYAMTILLAIYIVICIYNGIYDPLAMFMPALIWIVIIGSLSSYSHSLNENPNRIMNSYLDSLKIASYDSIEDSDVQIDKSIKAKVDITEIGPGQKKIEVTFNQQARELKKETIFRQR